MLPIHNIPTTRMFLIRNVWQKLVSEMKQSQKQKRIKRFALQMATALVVCQLLSSVAPREAAADEWMFRRSYYSHTLPPEVRQAYPTPESRSAYRRAYVGLQPGFAVRGGYRYNTTRLRSGSSVDTTITRENWFQLWP